jgi:hypothetical protein
LLSDLHARTAYIRKYDKEKMEDASVYLTERGVEFAQSEGTEILLAFCAALKEKLNLYDYELFHHFSRNLKRGIL